MIVSTYKGKDVRGKCKNCSGVSMRCILAKVYERVLIEKVRNIKERYLCEKQCGFRKGRSCVDQIFTVRQLSKKHVSKGRGLFVLYMTLEKAYDRIDKDAM